MVKKVRLEKSNNSEYWIKKISNNIIRDLEVDNTVVIFRMDRTKILGKRYFKEY